MGLLARSLDLSLAVTGIWGVDLQVGNLSLSAVSRACLSEASTGSPWHTQRDLMKGPIV